MNTIITDTLTDTVKLEYTKMDICELNSYINSCLDRLPNSFRLQTQFELVQILRNSI